jgi:hypothetical protein
MKILYKIRRYAESFGCVLRLLLLLYITYDKQINISFLTSQETLQKVSQFMFSGKCPIGANFLQPVATGAIDIGYEPKKVLPSRFYVASYLASLLFSFFLSFFEQIKKFGKALDIMSSVDQLHVLRHCGKLMDAFGYKVRCFECTVLLLLLSHT